MGEWKTTELSPDLCTIIAGSTPTTADARYWGGENVWITPNDLSSVDGHIISDSDRKLTDLGVKRATGKLLPAHSVVISCRAPVGYCAIVSVPFSTNQGCKTLICHGINETYLYYVLTQSTVALERVSSGTTFLELPKKELARFKMSFPVSTNEQSKIAEVLATVDEAIDMTRALIEKYKNIKAGMMQDLLANGIDENGMIRSPKTHEYKDSPIGSIPVEWDCSLICNVSEKIWIGLVTTMTKHYVSEGTMLIRNNNIRSGWIDVQDIIFLDIKFANLYASRALKTNDLVTVHTGDIGTTAIVTPELNGAHGFATINTRINRNKMIPEFLLYYYNSYTYKNRINVMATGDGRSNFNLYDYVKCYIPIPKIKEQQHIAKMLTAADERIQTERDYLTKLQNIKLGLMQDLLTNTVSVDALL